MKPTNPKTAIDQLKTCQEDYNQFFPSVVEDIFTQYALMDIDHDGIPELLLRTDNGDYLAVFSIALSARLLAGQSDRRFLSIYNGAVSHSGTCGALCMSEVYVTLKDSEIHHTLMDLQEYDHEKEDYGDSSYTLDGKPISVEEANKIIQSLGEPLEPKLQWKKLAF